MNPFRRLLALAINHFTNPHTGLAIGFAANINAEAIGADEWLKLSPYFEGDYWEQEKGKWNKYRQVVSREHGQRLVTAINAIRDKQGANFRGLPIYRGHPDADPQRWPDESRLGGVMEIEARDDGIYAKVAWNDEGERNKAQGYLVYPSPAWPYDTRLKVQSGRIEPLELRSVGMTNTPRIAGVPAWTNSDPISDEPGSDDATNQQTITMKKHLLKLLGLPEAATDADIETAVNAFEAKTDYAKTAMAAEKTKTIAACSERDQAKADAEKFRKLAINAKTTEAVNARKITAAELPAWEAKLATNFDEAATELAGKTATLPSEKLTITKRTDDISTPTGRKVAFNARIDELMAPAAQGGKGLGFDAAINAMRANPDDAALLAAMEPAATK